MAASLRVLLVEDDENDAKLLLRELRRGGYELVSERVDSPETMLAALDRHGWDVILCDYTLPRFSAPAALALVGAKNLDVPFIVVSGTIGEETAVNALRAGAHDFVTKDRLARLLPAIDREVREAQLRRERRNLHEQLLTSERMASMGMLAAGVAHEINNPLAVVIANLHFVAEELERALEQGRSFDKQADAASIDRIVAHIVRIKEPLQDAREAAAQVREIVHDIKMFSRPGEQERRAPVDVRRVMDSSLRMIANEIRHRARVVKDYEDVPAVDANESRLGQVFLNLLVNAAQAMPEGRYGSNEIRIGVRQAGEQVLIAVADTGTGIPAENLARLFQPFFTTKPPGVGTGLGLTICRRIVTSMGGQIRVESRDGDGALFEVMLPISRRHESAATQPKPPQSAPGRRGRILIIDDEATMSSALRRMMGRQHDAESVNAAAVAVERISGGARYDAILCDLMMPQMTGMEFYERLCELVPEQARVVIFMTGGAFTPAARTFLEQVPNARIDKPFDIHKLRQLVDDVLAGCNPQTERNENP